jgi:ATP synthase protein I
MSVALESKPLSRMVLIIQLIAIIIISSTFTMKSPHWGLSALLGGLSAWLPSILFTFLTWRLQGQTPAKGRVAWSFALNEIVKVCFTFILLVVALGVFRAAVGPLGLSWMLVIMLQVIAPVVINKKG